MADIYRVKIDMLQLTAHLCISQEAARDWLVVQHHWIELGPGLYQCEEIDLELLDAEEIVSMEVVH